MLDVALASCRELPEPDLDLAPLLAALAAAGICAEVLAWDDPDADFSRARLTLLRSTWNYPHDRAGFLRWAADTARSSELWNPLPVVAWSSHKRYLLDLERSGVPIAPTELLAHGSGRRLADLAATRGWHEIVVKPAVSAASLGTRRFGGTELDAAQAHLETLDSTAGVLVQAYLPSVEGHGERAIVWVDGEITHSVRKSPRFEGEDEEVSGAAVAVGPAEAALARSALDAARRLVGEPLMYGRVDMAPGADGRPLVMELELIEPSLFFAQSSVALERLVAAIARRLG